MPSGYDQDYYTWAIEQAEHLRARRLDMLDVDNLAEEVESLGRSEHRELSSRLAVIIGHLLTLQVQTTRTEANERSWRVTVRAQRARLTRLLDRAPGLKNPNAMADALENAWIDGYALAVRETGLPEAMFPQALPYRLDQLLDGAYWP